MIERSPNSVSAYLTLAEYYAENNELARAASDFEHALELAPKDPAIHDRYALVLWRQNKRAEALTRWRNSLSLLDGQIKLRTVPESFWQTFANVVDHLSTRKAYVELRS